MMQLSNRPDTTGRRFRRADEVVFEIAGDRAVLLDPDGKELITLNAVGTLVWAQLCTPRTAADVAAALRQTFPNVPMRTLEDDAFCFLVELAAAHVVVDDAAG